MPPNPNLYYYYFEYVYIKFKNNKCTLRCWVVRSSRYVTRVIYGFTFMCVCVVWCPFCGVVSVLELVCGLGHYTAVLHCGPSVRPCLVRKNK